jgi:hypothetical protein
MSGERKFSSACPTPENTHPKFAIDLFSELVQAAEDAISKRLQETSERSGHEVERQAMFDALGTLGFLKMEAQKPNWSRNRSNTE